MVFQDDNLFPHLSAERNVALGISPTWRLPAAALARAKDALARVGLGGLETRRPGELSGGERQRVALARAFLRERPILLLDEPFAALGPALRAEMLDLVRDLRRSAARPPTVVMVTHHPADAASHADRWPFWRPGTSSSRAARRRPFGARSARGRLSRRRCGGGTLIWSLSSPKSSRARRRAFPGIL